MKTWEFQVDGVMCQVTKTFGSETLVVDGVKVVERIGAIRSRLFAEVEVAGSKRAIEVYLGRKDPGFNIGCHVYVDGELVAGDTDVKVMCPTLPEIEAHMAAGMLRYLLKEGVLKFGVVYGILMTMFFAYQGQAASPLAMASKFVFLTVFFGGVMGLVHWMGLARGRDQILEDMPFEPRKHWGVNVERLSAQAVKQQKRAIIVLWVLLLPFVCVGAFYGFEYWRGNQAWKEYRVAREAAGESFDFKAFVPPKVAAEENFAMTPLLKAVLDIEYTENGPRYRDPAGMEEASMIRLHRQPDDIPMMRAMIGTWPRAEPTNLDALRWYFRGELDRIPEIEAVTNRFDGVLAQSRAADDIIAFSMTAEPESPARDILYALSEFNTELRKIQIDLQRPHCRYPLNYARADASIILPHLRVLARLGSVVRLRGVALLADGNTDRAMDDLFIGYDLVRSLKEEPFLISLLAESAGVTVHHQILWEGLRSRAWSSEQIAEMKQRLKQIQLLPRLPRALQADRVGTLNALEKRNLCYLQSLAPFTKWNPSRALLLVPGGWIRLNQVEMGRCYDEVIDAIVDGRFPSDLPRDQTYSVRAAQKPTAANYLIRKLPMQARSAWVKVLLAQTVLDLAIAACDLELYWQEYGSYPEELPEPIVDRASGENLIYRRTEDGRFTIYSVGQNGIDDGGVPLEKLSSKTGDWVWRYSAQKSE